MASSKSKHRTDLRRLTLVRHAKTEPPRPGQEDWDRVLEPRGQHDAPQMGRRLKSRYDKPNKILTSPAVRALTTASIFARELSVDASRMQQDERLYLAGPKDMLQVVRELGGQAQHLMVVGHNPGMSEFADRLCSGHAVDNLPTCAVFTVEFEIPDWHELDWELGINAELDYPKKG
jgi:phosphohistidine phosphatase